MVQQAEGSTTIEDARLVTLFNGDRMYIDSLDSLELGKKGIYEPAETEFIQSFVKKGMVCVDIGANIGYYTILMAKQAKHIIAFEPDEWNHYTLSRNIFLNDIPNTALVEAYPFAIGPPQIQMTLLYRCATNGGMHRVYPSHWCGSNIDTDTEPGLMFPLDKLVKHADFIKMDIEGAEYGALLGMRRILKEERPTLLMEFHIPSIREYGIKPEQIRDYMSSLSYNIEAIPSAYLPRHPFPSHMTWEEILTVGEHPGLNILCTPSNKR